MRKFTIFLTLLLLFVVGGVRAEVITTTPIPGVEYKIKCIATAHTGYLGDDGSTLQGRHNTGTIFVLEATSTAGQYYLKSKETGKYINAAGVTSGSAISFDATPTTYWTLDQTNADVAKNSWAIRPNGTAGVSLNNNGAQGTACPYMKVFEHNRSGQGCDLWTFDDMSAEQLPTLPYGKYIRVSSTKADFLTVATGADDNAHWYVMTQERGGESPMYDNGTNTMKRAAASVQVSGQALTTAYAKYLVRFFNAGSEGQYFIQFATGGYITKDLTVNSRVVAQPYQIYNIRNEATHIGWNLPNTDGSYGSRVDNNSAGSTLSFWGSGLITAPNGNNDWSIYPVEFVDPVNISYTLSAATTGETFAGSYSSGWAGEHTLLPVLSGAGAYTLSNANFEENGDAHTLTAVINFPFPVSSATKKVVTGIQSQLGSAYWRAKPNAGAYEAYSTNTEATITLDNADQFQWYIYPSFADGTFSFKIQNKESGKYLPALAAAQGVNKVNALADEASAGTYYYMPCIDGYYGFSINAAGTIFLTINTGSTDNQPLWAWTKSGTHKGSNLTFPAITKGEEYIEATINKYKSAPTLDILAGSTVMGPSEFAAPAEVNAAIAAANAVEETVAAKYAFINGETASTIQTYLNAVNTYGALTNYQFEVKYPYSTLILPCPSTLPSGITLYNCSATEANGYTLTLAEVSGNMTPNTPYIIASTVGNKYTIIGWDKGGRDTYTLSGSWLTGVLTEGGATVPADSYVLAAKNGQQGFYQTNGSVTCPQYKCYLTVPASAGSARAFYFPGDEPTSIEGIFAADESGTVSIYNLAGQKLNRLQKGINIVNGRKVVVK